MSEPRKIDMITAIHLDAVGGAAGDMFAAALLDAMPSAWPACQRAIAAISPPAEVVATIERHADSILTGSKFHVAGVDEHISGNAGEHEHNHVTPHSTHGHHRWRDIRLRLERAELQPTERDAAIGIFSRLAVAEAAVHGIAVEDVSFHEVGAWDSIIDIVTAAALIAQLPGSLWSMGSLPRGRGLVKSAHGMLPIPAPATLELLKGFDLHDDGEEGERITPTGAAILAYLSPSQKSDGIPRRLMCSGTGFGNRRFKQRSNILRATLYGASTDKQSQDAVEVLRCEIDDQTSEDLAIALENIRNHDNVLDVNQWPVFAKKGRMATAVQVLVRSGFSSDVIRVILDETTTLGVRWNTVARTIVEREISTFDDVRVKVAQRPSATTAKAEAADVEAIATHHGRQTARRHAEHHANTTGKVSNDAGK
jgi:uncharacterized protein (TIGR00299 family) protein